MTVTVVDIYNDALSNMGTRSTVATVGDGTTEEIELSRVYARVRDDVLKAHDWQFARRTVALATQAVAVAPIAWAYVYARPADCLRPLYMVVAGAPPDRYDGMPEIKYEASGDFDDTLPDAVDVDVIYTDQTPAYLRYTRRMADPDKWPSEFRSCVGWALAAATALNLTGSATAAQACARSYLSVLAASTTVNAKEGTTRVSDQTSAWDQARG